MSVDSKPAILELRSKEQQPKGSELTLELFNIDNLGISFDPLESNTCTDQSYSRKLLPTNNERPGRVVLEVDPLRDTNGRVLDLLFSLHKKIKIEFKVKNDPLLREYKTDMLVSFDNEIGFFKYELIGAFPLGFAVDGAKTGNSHKIKIILHYDYLKETFTEKI